MMKTVTRMLAATAALGLVVAPIAARANTRASDSSSVYSPSSLSNPGVGREDGGEGIVGVAGGLLFAIIGTTVIILGTIIAGGLGGGDNDEDGDQSPG